MRIEIKDHPVDIVTLKTDLAVMSDPGSELRSHKAGRLYVKTGPRHATGVSRSRLAYQAGGANYLDASVSQALRTRGVRHLDFICKNIMDAARPERDRKTAEPDRYLVGHARAMASIIALAEYPAARPLGFEAAVEMAAANWADLSTLDQAGVRQWWERAVRAQLEAARTADQLEQDTSVKGAKDAKSQPKAGASTDEGLEPAWFERKYLPASARPVPRPASVDVPQSAAQAQREAQQAYILWHQVPQSQVNSTSVASSSSSNTAKPGPMPPRDAEKSITSLS